MRKKLFFLLIFCLFLSFCASSGKKPEDKREEDPQYLYNVGLYHLNTGNFDEAIRYLAKVTSLDPGHYLALNAMGLAEYLKGRLNEAAEYFKKCLEVNPKFSEANNNLGRVYLEMGLMAKAKEEYLKALQDKDYSSKEIPYYNLAKMSLDEGHASQALEYVQKSIAENNEFAAAHNLKGLILEKLGKLYQAIKSYEEAIRIVPSSIDFNFNLAVVLFKVGKLRRAREIFEKILPALKDSDLKEKVKNYLRLIDRNKKSGVFESG